MTKIEAIIRPNKLDDVKQMFKDWTTYAANLTQGKNIKPYEKNPFVPPTNGVSRARKASTVARVASKTAAFLPPSTRR